jgi:uncharacterized protein YbjT (DUF2867 family)
MRFPARDPECELVLLRRLPAPPLLSAKCPKVAHQQGAETLALVSAIGASVNSSFFYPRTKGEVERDMKLVGFKSLTILRPSIISGNRDKSRFAEGIALGLSRILAPILPKKFHVNPAPKIATALVDSIIAAEPGCHYLYAESLV